MRRSGLGESGSRSLVTVCQGLVELRQDLVIFRAVREPLRGHHIRQVGDRDLCSSHVHDAGPNCEVVVSAAGRFEGDVEHAEGALEVPRTGPPERSPVVGERQALG